MLNNRKQVIQYVKLVNVKRQSYCEARFIAKAAVHSGIVLKIFSVCNNKGRKAFVTVVLIFTDRWTTDRKKKRGYITTARSVHLKL